MNDLEHQKEIISRIYSILCEIRMGKISVAQFCEDYENLYNLKLDKEILSEKERRAFQELFESVVWFSPYPEEVKKISRYLDESSILVAVEAASNILR